MKHGAEIIVVSLGACLAMSGAGFAADDLFRFHMWVLFFALAAGATLLTRGTVLVPAQARAGATPCDGCKATTALKSTINPAWND